MGFFSWLFGKKKKPSKATKPTTGAGMKKTLSVGINAYKSSPLAGCVNDLAKVSNYSLARGFEVRALKDGEATTKNIYAGLEWLVEGAKAGDTLLFHYSGHGVQVPTGSPTEPDGLAEAICPVDFDWTPEHMITDKDFVRIFSKLPEGVRFNWISDSCHSGDLTRGMGKAITGLFNRALQVFSNTPKVVEIPKTIPQPMHVAAGVRLAKSQGMVARAILNGKMEVGYVSGCRSDQTSADTYIDNQPCGALTYYFMKNVANMPNAPLSEVVAATSKELAANGYSQRPQCEGTRAGVPFLG